MTDKEEKAYMEGRQAAAHDMLQHLGDDLPVGMWRDLIVIADLKRSITQLTHDMGVDVPDNLHPADIVDNYFRPYLVDPAAKVTAEEERIDQLEGILLGYGWVQGQDGYAALQELVMWAKHGAKYPPNNNEI